MFFTTKDRRITSGWVREDEKRSCKKPYLWHGIQQVRILPVRCFSQRRKGLVRTLGTLASEIYTRKTSPHNVLENQWC